MDRRDFISAGTLSLCLVPTFGFKSLGKPLPPKPAWLIHWIKVSDRQVATFEASKITATHHPFVGGYTNAAGIPNPQSTSSFLIKACSLVACPESSHYRSKTLVKAIEAAARSMLRMQHPDGTIDLPETNFHSTPDTAFVLENVIPAYQFLRDSGTQGSDAALSSLQTFLKNAGEALIVGGIHTPNHRWVVSAALARLNEVVADRRYIARINQWLAEHIDLDPDGQFNEKSTNSYSPIVDRSLILMAKALGKPELLEPVRKNLMMTLYYIHPNGEVVTEASNRQDRGTIGTMYRYYYVYRYMALHDQNGEMAALCRLIENTHTPEQLAGYLPYFLEDPALWKELPATRPLPTHYAKAFPYSGVVRIRRGPWDCTLLSTNASWLTFYKGNAVLQGMRVAASFFGKGQFMTEQIEDKNGTWTLRQSLEGPYYQPIASEKIDPGGDWNKMPKSLRAQSEIQKLESLVQVQEMPGGMQVQIAIEGTDRVPVTLELIFRKGGTFGGVSPVAGSEDAYFMREPAGTYTLQQDTLHFKTEVPDTPAGISSLFQHKGLLLRGALPPMEAFTVYITGFTPFQRTISLS